MTTYVYKIHNEERWIGGESVHFSPSMLDALCSGIFEILERHKTKNLLKEEQTKALSNAFSHAQIIKKEQKELLDKLHILYGSQKTYWQNLPEMAYMPSHKTCLNLPTSYKSSHDNIREHLKDCLQLLNYSNEIYQLFLPFQELFKKEFGSHSQLKSYQNNYYDIIVNNYEAQKSSFAKKTKYLKLLETRLLNGEIVAQSRKIENSMVAKKSWAIFSTKNGQAGFRNKKAQVGEISMAALYDSDLGALNAAKASGLAPEEYDIVEVEVKLKKRMRLSPHYESLELTEALSIVEKEKLQSLLDDFTVQEIKNKLALLESKENSNQKIDLKNTSSLAQKNKI